MLGPGRYCTRTFKGITSIKNHLAVMLFLFRPETAAELEDSLTLLGKFKDGINQFKENLKYGIRTGMVGSVTVCKEGKGCLEDRYLEIASQRSGKDTTRTPTPCNSAQTIFIAISFLWKHIASFLMLLKTCNLQRVLSQQNRCIKNCPRGMSHGTQALNRQNSNWLVSEP